MAEACAMPERREQQRSWLLEEILRLDPNAESVTSSGRCHWVRSRFGFVGETALLRTEDPATLREEARGAAREAYSLLDALPETEFSFEEMWNTLLILRVPWTESELEQRPQTASVLAAVGNDLSGSRKIILPADQTLGDRIGPLGVTGTPWLPSSPDPLRDAVFAVARDNEERDALEALFKPRLLEAEVERLIDILARPTS